jgi:hypothetical protein
MLVVQPTPKRNWYRYSGDQMSGALPATLYKYFLGRYVACMLDRGELMFSTLAQRESRDADS